MQFENSFPKSRAWSKDSLLMVHLRSVNSQQDEWEKREVRPGKLGSHVRWMGFYSGLGFNWVSRGQSSLLGRFWHLTTDRLYGETVPQRNTTMGQVRECVLISLPFHAFHWFHHRELIMMFLGLFGSHSEARFHILWYGILPKSGSNRRSQRIYLPTG